MRTILRAIPDAAIRALARNGFAGTWTGALFPMSTWASVQHHAPWEVQARCLPDVPHFEVFVPDPLGAEVAGCC